MPIIGKALGATLGPRGKVPKPVPPKVKIDPFIQRAKKAVKISLKENPVIHVAVGNEKMNPEDIAKNVFPTATKYLFCSSYAYGLLKQFPPQQEESLTKIRYHVFL